MRAFVASLVVALAACSPAAPPASAPDAQKQNTPAAALAGEPMSTGLMGGMSANAPADMAALTIGADRLAFSNAEGEETFAAATEFLAVVDASTLIAADEGSFAAAAPSPNATRVELRRITGPAPSAICPDMTATYAALVSSEPLTGLHLMVFTGADAPGPDAHDSRVCATYEYAVD